MTGTMAADRDMVDEPVADAMVNRMVVAVLALVGVLISTYMTAYKLGALGDIVCGTGGCQTVQNSPWSSFMGMPVPMIGLAGYGALMLTAIAGLQPAFAHRRIVPLALAGGASIGLAFSAYLTYLEAFVIHAWCRWCVGSAVLAVLIFLFALPEFRRLRDDS
jgi:uncharacterized membrane protein